jgi:hypothetical protein
LFCMEIILMQKEVKISSSKKGKHGLLIEE